VVAIASPASTLFGGFAVTSRMADRCSPVGGQMTGSPSTVASSERTISSSLSLGRPLPSGRGARGRRHPVTGGWGGHGDRRARHGGLRGPQVEPKRASRWIVEFGNGDRCHASACYRGGRVGEDEQMPEARSALIGTAWFGHWAAMLVGYAKLHRPGGGTRISKGRGGAQSRGGEFYIGVGGSAR